MANNVLNWAYKIRHIKPAEKFVLVTMADHANKDGTLFPGVESIAVDCNMSARNLRRLVKTLEGHGLVRTAHRYREDGSFQSNLYSLSIAIDPADWGPTQERTRGIMSATTKVSASQVTAFHGQLRKQLDDQILYEQWLFPITPSMIEKGHRLIIKVPSQFWVSAVREKFAHLILDVARQTIAADLKRFHLVAPGNLK